MSIELSLPGCPMCGGSLEHAYDRDAVVCRNVIRGVDPAAEDGAHIVSGPCGYEISGEALLDAHTKGLSPFAAEKVPIDMPTPADPLDAPLVTASAGEPPIHVEELGKSSLMDRLLGK